MLYGNRMGRFTEFFTVIIVSMLFTVFGCGNNETGVESEFIYLKVDGMT